MRTRTNGELQDESGQVIVEFILVISILFTMIFLFVQLSWGIAWGHYTHYATYMASRAYLAGGTTKADQVSSAGSVLESMLKKPGGSDVLPFLSPSRGGSDRDATGSEPVNGAMVGKHPLMEGKENSRLYSWAEGVQYNYNLRVFLIPLSKMVSGGGEGRSIHPGNSTDSGKIIVWKGVIPFTSDSFLGREESWDECISSMNKLSSSMPRADGVPFLEDNGC